MFDYNISEYIYLTIGTLKGMYLSSNHGMQFQYPVLPLVFYAFVLFMALRIRRMIKTIKNTNKTVVLTVAVVMIALSVYPASAESGTITATNNSYRTYTIGPNAAVVGLFTEIDIDSTDYNRIVQIFINTSATNTAFATSGRSTPFTITGCGSGGGLATYSSASKAMAWYFSFPSTVTCSPLVLSYTTNIFDDITTNGNDGGILALTTAKPVAIGTADANHILGSNGAAWYYNVTVENDVSNNYVITYSNAGNTQLFETSITKVGVTTVNTKVMIENATGTPLNYSVQGDPFGTYNNINFDVVNVYGQGIALNMTTSTGDYERVIVNTTGSGLAPLPTPNASNPNAANCPVNCINTSKPTYNNTESVNVYGSFYPANTTVTDCLFFGFICEDTEINQESTTGYVFISTQGSTSPIKFIPFLTDQNNNYNLYTDLDIGTYQAQLYGFAAPGTLCSGGIVYDFPFIPLGCYYPHNITNFNVVNASGNLSIVWQTKLSNSTAIYGDTVTVAWSNVTANDTVRIYDETGTLLQFYNINQSTVSQIPVFIPLFHVGLFNATIFNGSDILHNATAYLNVVPPGAVDVNNSFGITMYWSKGTDFVGNPTQLNWNTGTFTGFYNITVLLDGNEVRRTGFQGVPGQAQVATYTFSQTGAYVAQFLDLNETVQQQATIRISAASATSNPLVTPPPSGAESAQDMGNNLIGFMSMAAFWGLIILVIVMWIAATKAPESLGIVTFIVANVEAVIGLWAPFTWYVLVITWVIAGIYFTVSRHTVTGVK